MGGTRAVAWCMAIATVGTGCRQILGIEGATVTDAAGRDTDMTIDTNPPTDAAICFGTYRRVCLVAQPMGLVTLSGLIDTDTDGRCQATDRAELCTISASGITIGTTVNVTGSRPLVVIATGNLAILSAGILDAGSTRIGPRRGPGSDPLGGCGTPTPASVLGGGAGGSFIDRGGNGGANGAVAPVPVPVSTLRGGCTGSKGAGPNGGAFAGTGGAGGGAVYLIGDSITIAGRINAGGAGGRNGAFSAGGASGAGGGGSGGQIVVEATMISITDTGRVSANGGGGGEGSTAFTSGVSGDDAINAGRAFGGVSGSGGAGGTGSYDATMTGGAGAATVSGGGGGGGAGLIRLISTGTINLTAGNMISPPQML